MYGFRHNNAYLNSLRSNQQSTSMEETKESPSSVGGEVEKVLHQEDWKSLQIDFEKDEEKSHENEEEYIETIEYHSKTHYIMDMDKIASTDGCLNSKGVPTDGCSQLYVGDIEIKFENVSTIQISHKDEDEDLVTDD